MSYVGVKCDTNVEKIMYIRGFDLTSAYANPTG